MAKTKNHSKNDENRELEAAYQKLSGKQADSNAIPPRNNGVTIVVCIALTAIIVCLGALLFYFIQKDMNRVIAGNVSVADIQLQGMTQAEAFKALEAGYQPQNMQVTVLEHSVQIPADCIKGLRTRKAVRAAYQLGNTTSAHNIDLTPYLQVDEERIRSILSELGNYYNTTMQESTYQVSGDEPNQVLQVTIGTPEYGLDMEKLYQDVLYAYGQNKTTAEGQCTLLIPKELDLENIWNTHCRAATDATYDLKVHQIVGGEDGYGFDVETAKTALASAKYGETLEFPFTKLSPSITRENAEAALFKDVLGTFTAKASSQSNRDVNLRLACEAINGIILYPGEKFSYNETLGERTPEKGYRPAGTYVGNETVNTYGGGICQVSSSLYYSVLCAELHVLERTNHGFLPSYMPRGLDATVNWGTLDFRFENTLDYPIRIEATANKGTTTVTLLGTETRDYRVELDANIIERTPYATEYETYTADNNKGYKDGDYIVKPHTGYFVKSYIYKYEIDSDKLIAKEYLDDSNYRVRNAVVCKIETGSTPETPPVTTDPPIVPDVSDPLETP